MKEGKIVIFRKLEDIPIESRRRPPILVKNMEHLFDGKTKRKVKVNGYYGKLYRYNCWNVHSDWTIEFSEFKEIMELFNCPL